MKAREHRAMLHDGLFSKRPAIGAGSFLGLPVCVGSFGVDEPMGQLHKIDILKWRLSHPTRSYASRIGFQGEGILSCDSRWFLILMPSTYVTHDDLCGAGQHQICAETKLIGDIAPVVMERVSARNVETRKIDARCHRSSLDKREVRKEALAHFSSDTVQLLLDRCNELSRSAREFFDAQPLVNKFESNNCFFVSLSIALH
jgi:hypothetical protein